MQQQQLPDLFFGLTTPGQVSKKWKELCSETTDRDSIKLLTEARDCTLNKMLDAAAEAIYEAKQREAKDYMSKILPLMAVIHQEIQETMKTKAEAELHDINLNIPAPLAFVGLTTLDQVNAKWKKLCSGTTDRDRIKLLTEAKDSTMNKILDEKEAIYQAGDQEARDYLSWFYLKLAETNGP